MSTQKKREPTENRRNARRHGQGFINKPQRHRGHRGIHRELFSAVIEEDVETEAELAERSQRGGGRTQREREDTEHGRRAQKRKSTQRVEEAGENRHKTTETRREARRHGESVINQPQRHREHRDFSQRRIQGDARRMDPDLNAGALTDVGILRHNAACHGAEKACDGP